MDYGLRVVALFSGNATSGQGGSTQPPLWTRLNSRPLGSHFRVWHHLEREIASEHAFETSIKNAVSPLLKGVVPRYVWTLTKSSSAATWGNSSNQNTPKTNHTGFYRCVRLHVSSRSRSSNQMRGVHVRWEYGYDFLGASSIGKPSTTYRNQNLNFRSIFCCTNSISPCTPDTQHSKNGKTKKWKKTF